MPNKNEQERREYHRRYAYATRTTPAYRERYLMERYGITNAQYEEALQKQHGLCAICGSGPSGGHNKNRLSVDHDHTTNSFRGLLCDHCNRNLAFVEKYFVAIMLYLKIPYTFRENEKARMDALKELEP